MPKLHRCRAGDDRQLVLVFIGTKIFLVSFIGKLPPELSLSVTFGLIAAGVIFSMWKTRSGALAPPEPRQSDAPA